ncbi:Protein RRC1 [Vitis vinifera]|uniref:Protein RRC1 n=1 Tax=Vitis vinifera TaxID=29760 RepID=A0A438F2D8_VITVI|nr:Protein RRC1 [Vitis vinifera]
MKLLDYMPEFVESFQGDNAPGSKTFVRGGTINPNERVKTESEGEKSKDGVSVPKKGSRDGHPENIVLYTTLRLFH